MTNDIKGELYTRLYIRMSPKKGERLNIRVTDTEGDGGKISDYYLTWKDYIDLDNEIWPELKGDIAGTWIMNGPEGVRFPLIIMDMEGLENYGARDNHTILEIRFDEYAEIPVGFCQNCTNLDGIIDVSAHEVYLETINAYAFDGCTKLKTIDLPYLKTIHHHAFVSCDSLEEFHFGEEIKDIYDNAFSDCKNLKVLDFTKTDNDKTGYIGENAFYNVSPEIEVWVNKEKEYSKFAGLKATVKDEEGEFVQIKIPLVKKKIDPEED